MYIEQLTLIDFRNYKFVEIKFFPGVTIFLGKNGQGKTNLVEAINYFSTLSSHRVNKENTMIRSGALFATVRGKIRYENMQTSLEIEISSEKTNQAKINNGTTVKPKEILGIMKTVIFSPEDLALIKGEPNVRRKFVDELLSVLYPRIASVRIDYERILKQRNTLLRSSKNIFKKNSSFYETLAAWDISAAKLGAQILSARLKIISELEPFVKFSYEKISAGNKKISINYETNLQEIFGKKNIDCYEKADLEKILLEAYQKFRTKEIERGVSLVGPHRDDIKFVLGEVPVKGYASHGESWSFALALKLASYELIKKNDGGTYGNPILILDDVFAELDLERRNSLANLVKDCEQIFITTAVINDIPKNLLGKHIMVQDGKVFL